MSTCPIQDCGQLPLVLGDIHGADIGSVLIDSPDYSEIKDPDSYQEKGLEIPNSIFVNKNIIRSSIFTRYVEFGIGRA